jgi:hypothetical protein
MICSTMRCPEVLTAFLVVGLIATCLQQVCSAQQGAHVLLHDPTHTQLRSLSPSAAVSSTAATATLCAAAGLVPPLNIDKAAAADAEGVVQSVLGTKAPRAVLLLHLAGTTGPGETGCRAALLAGLCAQHASAC